jgi:hypothetical protein
LHFEIQYKYYYTLRKDKNQGMRLGAFVYFHMWFLLWFLGSRRAFWYFYVIKPLFYSKKVSTRHVHALTSRCRLWCLGGVWGPIWWPNMLFCHVIWCTTVFFFYEVACINILWLISCRRSFISSSSLFSFSSRESAHSFPFF